MPRKTKDKGMKLNLHFRGEDNQAEGRAFATVFRRLFDPDPPGTLRVPQTIQRWDAEDARRYDDAAMAADGGAK